MGKHDYRYTDNVKFGQLPKIERKVITKMTNRKAMKLDSTSICTSETGTMLLCFEAHDWNTAACLPQIAAMHSCVEEHKHDPDPNVMARQWQSALQQRVLGYFAKQRVLGPLRKL